MYIQSYLIGTYRDLHPYILHTPKERDTCNVTIEGLDAENCYSLQVRVKATQVTYGSDTYPSDWSEVMHWQRGEQMGNACYAAQPRTHRYMEQNIVKKCLMPSVADPISTFPGLFEKHEGNFQQEWIRDTQNLAFLSSLVGGEPDAGLEEPAVLQVTSTEPEPARMIG
ncbi:hypothetical protein P7K49_014493 [Saguinus oedipus]|uniref:Cytokine receptor-like factor 2-like D2 domain-containing protein n=1 Tax=Saguinus oedipus TaxID=9490 RepID=A0ABQ9VL75_SAGOE|nr:hypothetical protein P7K49_014493 [Saguinus oedipus]